MKFTSGSLEADANFQYFRLSIFEFSMFVINWLRACHSARDDLTGIFLTIN